MKSLRGFTLIELLIVVAIIAILAAIAVPNFLEAQVRSKVSRCRADMRSLAIAIESYAVDNNRFPPIAAPTSPRIMGGSGDINGPSVFYADVPSAISSRFVWVTTPIAYITSVFRDPFIDANTRFAYSYGVDGTPVINPRYDTYDYVNAHSATPGEILGVAENRGASISSGAAWHLVGCGPNKVNAFGGGPANHPNYQHVARGVDYDPTNGTTSVGDIVRIGGGPGPLFEGGYLPAIDRINNKYNF